MRDLGTPGQPELKLVKARQFGRLDKDHQTIIRGMVWELLTQFFTAPPCRECGERTGLTGYTLGDRHIYADDSHIHDPNFYRGIYTCQCRKQTFGEEFQVPCPTCVLEEC